MAVSYSSAFIAAARRDFAVLDSSSSIFARRLLDEASSFSSFVLSSWMSEESLAPSSPPLKLSSLSLSISSRRLDALASLESFCSFFSAMSVSISSAAPACFSSALFLKPRSSSKSLSTASFALAVFPSSIRIAATFLSISSCSSSIVPLNLTFSSSAAFKLSLRSETSPAASSILPVSLAASVSFSVTQRVIISSNLFSFFLNFSASCCSLLVHCTSCSWNLTSTLKSSSLSLLIS